MQKKLLSSNDGLKIAINHYKLDGSDEVIIICPGWFMTKDSAIFKKLAAQMNKICSVIVLDFRGHGESSGFFTFTAKEVEDLRVVADFAITQCGYKHIYLCGFSLGGATVINFCSEYNFADKAIVVSAPSEFLKIENKMYSPDAWIPTLFQKFEPKRWLTIRPGNPFLGKMKPIDRVEMLNIPTLFIAGQKDPTVCEWHTKALFEKAKCKKYYKCFENARHAEDIYHDFEQEFIDLCVGWIQS